MKNLVKGIMAGVSVSFGCICYLACESSLAGALLFSIGLFTIYLFGWNLFTGKSCYIVGNKPNYMVLIANTFVGNLIGTGIMGYAMRLTKHVSYIGEKAESLVASKIYYSNLSAFILAIGCGMLMYVAVVGYRTIGDDVGKYLIIIFPITVFIICGFEHVVANMFYISMANAWDMQTLLFTLLVGVGNMIGCSVIPFVHTLIKEEITL